MFREVIFKLGGATLLLLGIGIFALGFLTASKFWQGTGFMCCVMAATLLYYAWARARAAGEEPRETR
jgi:membrane protein implicated in regulation of membrane protease activity